MATHGAILEFWSTGQFLSQRISRSGGPVFAGRERFESAAGY